MLVAPSESQTPCLRQRHLHHVLGKVAGRMPHVLPGRRDATERRVIVGAEMRAPDTAAARRHERAERGRAVGREDRLRGFDHQLERDRSRSQLQRPLERRAGASNGGDMARRHQLGNRDHEVRRQSSARGTDERRHEQVERAQAARVQFVRHRLDPDADEWRQRASLETGGDLLSDRYGMRVLFGIRPDAVSVLEVDAEVLDRLARQLVDDAAANSLGQRALVRTQSERSGKRRRVGRVLLEHGSCDRAYSCGGVGLEEMRTTIDAVDGLPVAGFTGIGAADGEIGALEFGEDRLERPRVERSRVWSVLVWRVALKDQAPAGGQVPR